MDTLCQLDLAAHRLLDETLPIHPRTGLRAVGIVNGKAVWPILGGADDDGDDDKGDKGGDDDDADDDADDTDDGDDDDADDDDKPLGPKGERALQAEKDRRKKARAAQVKAETDLATARKEIARLKGGGKKDDDKKDPPDDAPDADQIREEAKKEARTELLHSRVEDKIEAKATKFADPADAAAILLKQRKHDDFIDDDEIDVDEIIKALAALAKKKPHLLTDGPRFKGGADGGARKTAKGQVGRGQDRMRAAYAESSKGN